MFSEIIIEMFKGITQDPFHLMNDSDMNLVFISLLHTVRSHS